MNPRDALVISSSGIEEFSYSAHLNKSLPRLWADVHNGIAYTEGSLKDTDPFGPGNFLRYDDEICVGDLSNAKSSCVEKIQKGDKIHINYTKIRVIFPKKKYTPP
ncbi:hypothetical protein AG1IA_07918 [Rhizoctonia solani AG-1 IA]|uniref:Uncharacterized protein n=1 Tax=Thanatephorus cucumeris (strain AG1-IA) TaxID=983506 RepID=L8WJE6_THACA|nr:hypothetical protein AG1IA_07918 [Rhizoctonia solani AG-1 IA]